MTLDCTDQAMSSACWCASMAVSPDAVLITLNDSFVRMSHNRTSPLMLQRNVMS